ncbi:MAG: hypothetical protein M1814_004459 [Vezdaea aestivalis]|nr:MAG: hypothetical protein M1814_004459 [Vezdaea aestivalis]
MPHSTLVRSNTSASTAQPSTTPGPSKSSKQATSTRAIEPISSRRFTYPISPKLRNHPEPPSLRPLFKLSTEFIDSLDIDDGSDSDLEMEQNPFKYFVSPALEDAWGFGDDEEDDEGLDAGIEMAAPSKADRRNAALRSGLVGFVNNGTTRRLDRAEEERGRKMARTTSGRDRFKSHSDRRRSWQEPDWRLGMIVESADES